MSAKNEERPVVIRGQRRNRGLVKHWLSSVPESPKARGIHLIAAVMLARQMQLRGEEQ